MKKNYQPIISVFYIFLIIALFNVVYEVKAEDSSFSINPNITDSSFSTSIVGSESLQQVIVNGNITDENGLPIAGVNVLEKGTSNGVVSDFDGNYSISVNSSNSELEFSIVGFKTLTIVANDMSATNIQMEEDIDQLDEVVLVGYGTQTRKGLTGATANVSAEELSRNRIITNVADALKGQVSGVRVTQDSGGPNAQNTISIRGATSVFGDNQPLYVVDGFPLETYDLAAADIESIDILKDASSTAIYGSRGANGVILITTKRGKKGKTRVNVTVKNGISSLARRVDMIDNVEWIKQVYEQNLRFTNISNFNGQLADHLDYYQDIEGNIWTLPKYNLSGAPHQWKNHERYRDSTNTDWQDTTLRNGLFQDYKINLSGGTERTVYDMSLNMISREGLVPNNKLESILARFNFSHKLSDKINVTSNNYFNKSKRVGFEDVAQVMLNRPPIVPPDGRMPPGDIPGYVDIGLVEGPVEQTEVIDRDDYTSIFQSNLSIDYTISPKLNLIIGGSYRNVSITRENYTPRMTPYGYNSGGFAEYRNDQLQDITNQNYLTYTESFNDHNFTLMVGTAAEWHEVKYFGAQNRSFALESLAFYGFSGGTDPQIPNLDYQESSLLSTYGRLGYSFKDKYFLNATLRYDGSSRLAEGYEWDYFPAVGSSWRVSEEPIFKEITWFPSTKIRASWGISGKQSISPYQSLSVIESRVGSANGFGLSQIAYPSRIGNDGLAWEKNEEFDLGIDLSFLNGRYSLTMDLYRKTTKDLLIDLPTPNYTGFATNATNFGKLRNEGLEIQLNVTPIDNEFKWNSNLNFTFNRSEVLDVGNQNEIVLAGIGILRKGEAIGEWFGYEQDGIWQSQAEIDEAVANGFISQLGTSAVSGILAPGNTRFVDQPTIDTNGDGIPDTGDGEINANDRVLLGQSAPVFTGGFYNTFSFKGFSLNVGFQFSDGANVYNQNRVLQEAGRGGNNQTIRSSDRWVPDLYHYDPSDPTNLVLARPGNPGNVVRRVAANIEDQVIDRNIEDGSFVRFSDLSLAYDLPDSLLDQIGFESFRIFLTGQNLKIWTDYEGYDPEVNTGTYRSLLPGLDLGAYPRERTYAIGLQVAF